MWGGGEEGSSKTMLIQQGGGGGSNRDSVETVVYSDSPQQQQRHLVTSGQGHPSGHGSWSHLGTLPRGHGSGGRRNLAAECSLSTNSATRKGIHQIFQTKSFILTNFVTIAIPEILLVFQDLIRKLGCIFSISFNSAYDFYHNETRFNRFCNCP